MQYIKRGEDFILASGSEDRTVALICLKECVLMYKLNMPGKVWQIEISNKFNRMYVCVDNEQIFKIQMPEEKLSSMEDIEDKIANNLSDNIKRSFLNSKDHKLNLARVQYISPDNFIFDKINLNTLCIMFGNEDALQISCQSRKILTLIDDKTLVELCHDTKDYAC